MNKYLIFIIIGIIIFLIWNNFDSFNVGIPWRLSTIQQKYSIIDNPNYMGGPPPPMTEDPFDTLQAAEDNIQDIAGDYPDAFIIETVPVYQYFDDDDDAENIYNAYLALVDNPDLYEPDQIPIEVDEDGNEIESEQENCETSETQKELKESCNPPNECATNSSLYQPYCEPEYTKTSQGGYLSRKNECEDFHRQLSCLSKSKRDSLFNEYVRISILFKYNLLKTLQNTQNLALLRGVLNIGGAQALIPYELLAYINIMGVTCDFVIFYHYSKLIEYLKFMNNYDSGIILNKVNDSDILFTLLLLIELGISIENITLDIMLLFTHIHMNKIRGFQKKIEIIIMDHNYNTTSNIPTMEFIKRILIILAKDSDKLKMIQEIAINYNLDIKKWEDILDLYDYSTTPTTYLNIFRDLLEKLNINKDIYLIYLAYLYK